MEGLKQIIESWGPEEAAQFRRDVDEIAATQAGDRVIRRLLKLQHPLRLPLQSTSEATHVAIGRQEVIALLIWGRAEPATA